MKRIVSLLFNTVILGFCILFTFFIIVGFFNLGINVIFSKNGFGVLIVSSVVLYLIFEHARKEIDYSSAFTVLILSGFLVFLPVKWVVEKLNLHEKIYSNLYQYKGIVTKFSEETISSEYYEPGLNGGNITQEVDDLYDYQNQELFRVKTDISDILATYKRSNEIVYEKKFVFWQVAYIEGFKVDVSELSDVNSSDFKFIAGISFVLENFLRIIPYLFVLVITEIFILILSGGKRSISLFSIKFR